MQGGLHIARFHALRIADNVKKPLWRGIWNNVQMRCGGPDRFPGKEEFLASATEVYQFLQQESLTKENTRHLEDIYTEDLWPTVRSAGAEYSAVRRQFGDECRFIWRSTDPFIRGVVFPDEGEVDGLGPSVTISARFFSVMSVKYAPDHLRYAVDEMDFVSDWDPEVGVKQWKIARIGAPLGCMWA
mmetsp:Transcript_74060/g.128504  ORF Transcript_74060/g.128504 Transcript_74060/m.128504 type:complete len:186 (+) Transcript_74060:58-615(+)